jgi:OOP family OmpA-OmpF porin
MLKRTTIAGLLAAAGLAASQATFAQARPDMGGYVGGSVGQMEADGTCGAGFSCDLEDTAFKIFGGYRFNRNLAGEVFWGEWGEITVRSGAATATGEIRTIGVSAVGILPLNQQFELFGKVGFGNTKQKVSGSAPGVAISGRQTGTEILYGFGAAYNVNRNLGLRAEWEFLDDSEVDVMSVGIEYRF